MKKLLVLSVLVFTGNIIFSQVIYGNSVGTASNKTSVLMEFAKTENRGLILPYVTDKSGVFAPGSIILNATTANAAKAEFYDGTNWNDLSFNTANVSSFLGIQPVAKENPDAKVIIGNNTSSADGILVLESATKAMVLPTVNSYKDIVNPAPGMMVLQDNGTEKVLAFYNGSKWTFFTY